MATIILVFPICTPYHPEESTEVDPNTTVMELAEEGNDGTVVNENAVNASGNQIGIDFDNNENKDKEDGIQINSSDLGIGNGIP